MSSMNTITNLSNSDMNTEFIRYMKCAGALVSPNDITKYLYNPYTKVVGYFPSFLKRGTSPNFDTGRRNSKPWKLGRIIRQT
jgi:hypothetical protein